MPVAPKGHKNVFLTCGCGTSANETAFKLAFDHYYRNNPNGKEPVILAFKGGFHGRTFGSLATTYSKSIHKIGIKTFSWVHSVMPEIKYPYAENEKYNTEQENKALEYLENLFINAKNPIAGVIIEPIQAEGGDRSASPNFFIGIQEIVKKNNAVFIVDEVQTGCGSTGRFWAHEHWGPRADPDIVTFAKKLQVAGIFHKKHLVPRRPEALFNSFHSDHLRLQNFKSIFNVIQEDKLLQNTENVGKVLRAELRKMQERFAIRNVRGIGTFIAFDMDTPQAAGDFVKEMANVGVNCGTCGERSIRLRPSLIFTDKHAQVLLGRVEFVLQRLSKN